MFFFDLIEKWESRDVRYWCIRLFFIFFLMILVWVFLVLLFLYKDERVVVWVLVCFFYFSGDFRRKDILYLKVFFGI